MRATWCSYRCSASPRSSARSSPSMGTSTTSMFARFCRRSEVSRRRASTIGLVHDAGPPAGRPAVCVPGSRTLMRSSSGTRTFRCTGGRRCGFQIFNPGSPTERRQAPEHTMGIAHAHRERADVRADLARTDRLTVRWISRCSLPALPVRFRRRDAGCRRCSCVVAATGSCSTAVRAPNASSSARLG